MTISAYSQSLTVRFGTVTILFLPRLTKSRSAIVRFGMVTTKTAYLGILMLACSSRNRRNRWSISVLSQSLAVLGNSHNPLSFTTWSQPLAHVGIVTIGYLYRNSHRQCLSRNSHNRLSIRNPHNHVPISEESQIVVYLEKRLNKCLTGNNCNQLSISEWSQSRVRNSPNHWLIPGWPTICLSGNATTTWLSSPTQHRSR